ncbi:hypothetical protein HUU53_01850 [Candidatus Micrarchaeota archaeon]|nr:hypothetical protein [Candidatus Micrarchaeota archaeon]
MERISRQSTISNADLRTYLGSAAPAGYTGDLPVNNAIGTELSSYGGDLNRLAEIDVKKKARADIQTEIDKLRESKPALEKLNDLASKRLVTSYFIGGAWLGPARLAYSASNGLIFEITRQDSQYLRVYAGKTSKDVGKDFRDATNFLGSGRIQEILADYMGGTFTPDKAFKAGQLFIINRPKTASSVDESINSITGISSTGVNWNVYSNWKGNSIAVNFEDLSLLPNTEKYTSLPMVYYTAQGNVPEPLLNLDRKDVADFYSGILQLSLPFVISRGLNQYSALYALSTGLLVNQYVLDIDTDEFKGIDCSKDHLDTLKNYYRAGKATEWILQTLMPALPVIQSSYVSKSTILQSLPLIGSNSPLRGVINDGVNLVNTLNVPQAFELYWGNKALQYVADCKDNQYKVFNYQLLESRKTLEQREAELSENDPITKLINKIPISQGKLTLSEAAKETFYSELDLSNDVEVLNLKSDLTDQTGFVQPTQLKHVHIEQSSWSVKGKLYEKLSGSPDSCIPNEVLVNADGSAYQLGKDGLRKINSDGSIAFEFDSPEWADRALSALRNQEIARIILPNKIIYTQLACSSEFMQVNNIGAATLSQTSCPAIDCIKEKIKEVTNREVGSDLTPFIGQVTSIDTSLGRLVFDGQQINFVSTKGNKPGVTETNSNAAASITGDGKVIIKTPAGEIQAGDLLTIYSKKAKIEHNPETHEISIFLYLLAEGNKNFFNGFSTNLATTTLDDGSTIETPKIEIRGKTGFEEATSQLNDALKSIQGDGGVLSFETPDAQYLFTKDSEGNDVLRRIDKATGEVTDYKITGPITRNADGSFNIPTDKGPVTINFGQNEKGEPAVSVKGPGFEEVLATLLAARGQNGILAFNPSTGAISIYNGQDLPLNPAFATNGIGFSGGQDGTRGVPEQNPFAIPRNNNPQPTRQPTDLGALPSWPENVALAILMLTTILAGVLFARNKE